MEYETSPAYQTIQAARQALNVSFTQQDYQKVRMMVADIRMQIEYDIAVDEWVWKNPPPQLRRANRDGLRAAGRIAAIAMNYAGVSGGGYVEMGTQAGAALLEKRDAAIKRQQEVQRARRMEIMREQLVVYTTETGSPLGFIQSQEQRTTTLDELGKQMKPYQGRKGYQAFANEINTLRTSNNQGVVVTSQIADLKQRIDDFVAEQEKQRVANEKKLAELEEWLSEHQSQSQTYHNLAGRITSLRKSNDQGSDVTSQVAILEKDIERFIAAPNQSQQQRSTPQRGRR
jgi:hypothetical protein